MHNRDICIKLLTKNVTGLFRKPARGQDALAPSTKKMQLSVSVICAATNMPFIELLAYKKGNFFSRQKITKSRFNRRKKGFHGSCFNKNRLFTQRGMDLSDIDPITWLNDNINVYVKDFFSSGDQGREGII